MNGSTPRIEIKDGMVWITTDDGSTPDVLINGVPVIPESRPQPTSVATLNKDETIPGAVMGDLTIHTESPLTLNIEGDVVGSLSLHGPGSVSVHDVGASVHAQGDIVCQGKIGGSATAGGSIHSRLVGGTQTSNTKQQD